MGIVVCISMLLGLLIFTPKAWLSNKVLVKWQSIIAAQLFLLGVWNAACVQLGSVCQLQENHTSFKVT